jgi:hypothetical protein
MATIAIGLGEEAFTVASQAVQQMDRGKSGLDDEALGAFAAAGLIIEIKFRFRTERERNIN